MNRIDRLSAILIQLQSKKVVKAQEIADRFDISVRTVYRDVRALEEAGIPIGAEAGVGYYINSEYHLPPVMFTKEEAVAFLLADKLIGKLSDSKVSQAFESAMYKVKSILRMSEKEYLENLNNKIAVFNKDPLRSGHQDLFLFEIQTALANKQLIRIEYTANYNGRHTCRTIEPVSLCHYDMRWHLIAFCQLRKDYRDFRLDRIASLCVLDEHYKENAHISLTEYFKRMTEENSLYTVVLKVHTSIIKHLDSSKYWFGLIEELHEGEYSIMRFAHSDIRVFGKWILSMGNQVEIVKPPELKDIVLDYVTQLAKYYVQE